MAVILAESVDVAARGDRVHITHALRVEGGVDMGGVLEVPASACRWLAEQLEAGAPGQGPAGLEVFLGGTDWQPFVHVHAPGPQAMALTVEGARMLAARLRG